VSQNAPGAAGDHDAEGGVPIGYAFAKITMDTGMDPNVTISHEVLEMIGDSLIDQANQWSDLPNPLFLAQELCDPVRRRQPGLFQERRHGFGFCYAEVLRSGQRRGRGTSENT
jgi:hypothetical protein